MELFSSYYYRTSFDLWFRSCVLLRRTSHESYEKWERGKILNLKIAVMVAHMNEPLCEVISAKPLDDASRQELMEALKKLIEKSKNV